MRSCIKKKRGAILFLCSYAKRLGLTHAENEQFIDLLCRDVFGELRIDYRMQPMGEGGENKNPCRRGLKRKMKELIWVCRLNVTSRTEQKATHKH
jgi:hypothetical protein